MCAVSQAAAIVSMVPCESCDRWLWQCTMPFQSKNGVPGTGTGRTRGCGPGVSLTVVNAAHEPSSDDSSAVAVAPHLRQLRSIGSLTPLVSESIDRGCSSG